MRLVWCLSVLGLVGAARISHDLYYNIGLQNRENDGINSVPAAQPFTYHVPGAVYNVPSAIAAPPQTPASTVLLPMLAQASGVAGAFDVTGSARLDDEDLPATGYSNAFDKCVWLFQQCTGVNVSAIYDPKDKRNPRMAPTFLQYGYGVPGVQYPVHVTGPQYPVHVVPANSAPMPTTYGSQFWCGILAWKCLPDIAQITGGAGLPFPIIGK